MSVTGVEPIRVVESAITNVVRVEVTPAGSDRPLILRVVPSARTTDWIVRDPFGATICRVATRELGIKLAATRAKQVLDAPTNTPVDD